jgi:ribonuclease D
VEDRAFGVSLAWDDKATFIRNTDFGVSNIGTLMTDLFKADYKTFIFHNCEFDLHMLRETYGVLPPKNILDTLRLAHLRDTGGEKGLLRCI